MDAHGWTLLARLRRGCEIASTRAVVGGTVDSGGPFGAADSHQSATSQMWKPTGKRAAPRKRARRGGTSRSAVVLGGQRIASRPRARSLEHGELELPAGLGRAPDPLDAATMGKIAAGVSTRRYADTRRTATARGVAFVCLKLNEWLSCTFEGVGAVIGEYRRHPLSAACHSGGAAGLYLRNRLRTNSTLSKDWRYRGQAEGARRWLLGCVRAVGLANVKEGNLWRISIGTRQAG